MKLKEFVKINDLNISKLQKATGIPYATLLTYVNETHEPSLKNALKIQEATLDIVTVEDLVNEKN